jgi:hypothetical protein
MNITLIPRIGRCTKCKLEFTYVSTGEVKPFCPICFQRVATTAEAEPIVKQCSYCGCAPCACDELYSEEDQ